MKLSPLYVFYSWNEAMDNDEIAQQMREFAARGITGVFIHARGGLEIEYFGREWFEKIALCIRLAKEYGMEVGLYDENGWPSGFGGGTVNGLGPAYWQKKLRVSPVYTPGANKKLLAEYRRQGGGYVRVPAGEGELFAVAESNPGYVDILSPRVADAFIANVHERYREKFGAEFGKTIRFLFTDEPQLAAPYAYSEGMEEIFRQRYGYDMLDELWRLGTETRGFSAFHSHYRTLCAQMFHENYTAKIAKWCEKNHLLFTGHFACEENCVTLNLNGGPMNGYRYMQAPGVDALGRCLLPPQLFEQVVSAKNFFGRDYALSETFGCAGWSAAFADFMRIWANQAVRGINLPCLHLSAYSIRGIRKRDYPAFFSYQEPWWDSFGELARRLRFAAGFVSAPRDGDILVVTPEYSSFGLTPECLLDRELAARFGGLVQALEEEQAAFDVVNGAILDAFAGVEGGELVLRGRKYAAVIVSACLALSDTSRAVLSAAAAAGIPVGFADLRAETSGVCAEIGGVPMASAEDFLWRIRYRRRIAVHTPGGGLDKNVCVRSFGNRYAVFNKEENARKRVRIFVAGAGNLAVYDMSGTLRETAAAADGWFDADLLPGELLLLEKTEKKAAVRPAVRRTAAVRPDSLCRLAPNCLTLDRARFAADGGSYSDTMPVLRIEEMLSGIKCGKIKVRYTFFADFIPDDLHLCAEKGAESVSVNGGEIPRADGWFVDKAIYAYPIAALAKTGENSVELVFTQKRVCSASALDSENEIDRNLFSFDLEIENIYLTGSFSVQAPACAESCRTLAVPGADFRIVPEKPLVCGELTSQGLWFYRGDVAADFCLPAVRPGERIFLRAEGGGQICGRAECEGTQIAVFCGEGDEAEVTGYAGKRVRFVITAGNRNLFGPHHHAAGDPVVVGGNTFRGVRGFEDEWSPERYLTDTGTESYNFVRCAFPRLQLVYR